jgi:peptide deformylase
MSSKFKMVLAPSQRLREKSRLVAEEEFGEDLNSYMDDMLVQMYGANGVGLAGVQVGDSRRLIVMDPGTGPAKMVNPEILETSEEKEVYTEGCLSLPGFKLDVERSKYIVIKYYTPLGEAVEGTLTNIHAAIVQHEVDHLDGKTLLNKASGLKRDMYFRKLKKKQRLAKKLMKKMSKYGY